MKTCLFTTGDKVYTVIDGEIQQETVEEVFNDGYLLTDHGKRKWQEVCFCETDARFLKEFCELRRNSVCSIQKELRR